MTTARRRVLRPRSPRPVEDPAQVGRVAKAREQLGKERASLHKWWSKLKRAFTTIEKIQKRMVRLNAAASASVD